MRINDSVIGAWSTESPKLTTMVQDALSAWADDALNRLRWNKYTVRQVCLHVRRLAEMAGTPDLADITVDDALRYLKAMPSPQTARQRRTCMSSVWKFLIMHGLLADNPLAKITMPRVPNGRGADIITHKEMLTLIQVSARDVHDRRSTGIERARFYRFMWGTGLRYREAREQRWEDVDFRQGIMRVTASKEQREEYVTLPPWLLKEMKTWPRAHERVLQFVPTHRTIHADFERAGIYGRGCYHRFRKGAITHMARCGAPLHVLRGFSRHKNVSVLLSIYTHANAAEFHAAQRLMEV